MSLPIVVLLKLCLYASADVIFSNLKNPSESATSLAVDGDTFYLTYVDFGKESGINGFLKSYKFQASDSKEELKKVALTQPSEVLISPISVQIDECYRLWILDSGVQNISGVQYKTSEPTLQAIHLKYNRTQVRYKIPEDLTKSESLYTSFTVDIGKTCEDTWVYVADIRKGNILIFNYQNNSAVILNQSFFFPSTQNIPMIYHHEEQNSETYGLVVVGSNLIFHPPGCLEDYSISASYLKYDEYDENLEYTMVTPISGNTSNGVIRFDKTTSIIFYAAFQKVGCRGVGEKFILSSHYEEIDVGVTGYITDLQIVGPRIWILVNSQSGFSIETREIEQLIAQTSCKRHTGINVNTRSVATQISQIFRRYIRDRRKYLLVWSTRERSHLKIS